jgi:hypothetical protein
VIRIMTDNDNYDSDEMCDYGGDNWECDDS